MLMRMFKLTRAAALRQTIKLVWPKEIFLCDIRRDNNRATINLTDSMYFHVPFRGPPFSLEWGGHEFPKVPRQYFCDPLFDDQKFYDLPLRNYNVEETC